MSQDETTVSLPSDNHALSYEFGETTSVGGRNYNEDFVCRWGNDDWACFVVADGAGGHGGGDVAAKLAAEYIVNMFSASPTLEPLQLQQWVAQANEQILLRQHDGAALSNMHTTVVAVFLSLRTSQMRWIHVGDSRLYLFRDNKLLFRTKDHSTVQAMIDAGALSDDATRSHPKRNELYAALGEPTQNIPIEACEFALRLWPNDFILMCSDGLWEHVEDDEIFECYRSSQGTLNEFLKDLTALALSKATSKRPDNLSAIALLIR